MPGPNRGLAGKGTTKPDVRSLQGLSFANFPGRCQLCQAAQVQKRKAGRADFPVDAALDDDLTVPNETPRFSGSVISEWPAVGQNIWVRTLEFMTGARGSGDLQVTNQGTFGQPQAAKGDDLAQLYFLAP